MRTIGILLAVAACDGGGSDDGKGPVEDCPGATTEVCNGVDDDCDGTVDEGVAIRSWADADGDGFGDPDAAAEGCAPPAGSALRADDCDDAQTAVHPGATEVCNERDDDCDGSTDENVTVTWFVDEDRDGFGGSGTAEGCATPDDGSALTGDCDDADPSVGPGAVETCDGVDQDCDGTIDEGAGVSLWPDADGDGYGNAADGPAEVCVGTPGWVGNGDDCDDGRADVFMGAPEVCDGVDQDCDSVLDEGTLLQRWADDDGDGYGDPAELHIACADADGWVANHEDCDDAEPLAHTGAGEGCDGVDNDCDGDVDEGLAIRWYPDGDGDGFGDAASEQWSCAAAAGAAFVDGDCDDGDGGVHPRAVEVCDTVDQDCDGRVDEGLTTIWWPDVDADGWGADGGEQETCVPPPDAAFRAGDCLDTDSTAHPGALEVCDTVDDDCDGLVDDGVTRLFWTDADGDGFGAVGAPVAIDCDGGPDTSMVGGDCDDGDAGIGGPTCPPDLAGDFGTFGVDDG
ncbi:MAG: putative metal-binding motif-containing protein, partial [Myxococcota bacterium]